MFDVNRIRKDFPILEEKIYGKPLVYLDNGATTFTGGGKDDGVLFTLQFQCTPGGTLSE